ncbi:ATP-binding cassette domain-containing protein [Tistrella bauzanensis]
MSEAAALGLEHVTVHLGGRPVLHDLSLDLVPGEMLALVGPNGSGKTTALRVMASALEPAAGRVLLDGALLADRARRMRARDVAYLPQGFRSHWNLTVAELIRLGRERGAGWLPGGVAGGASVRGGRCHRRQRSTSTGCSPGGSTTCQGSGRGRRWPGRWRHRPGCCWPTSPQPVWTSPMPWR